MKQFSKLFQDTLLQVGQRISRIYEHYLGIDTWKTVRLDESTFYEPANYSLLKKIFKSIEIKEGDTFIDFGSGKGRVLMMAARYPFKRVIGIDLSLQLNEMAWKNIRKVEEKLKCKDFAIVTQDAQLYNIPHDVTVAYFYNPFPREVFFKVLENMKKSLNIHPREFTLIYNNPVFFKELEGQKWLTKVLEYKMEFSDVCYFNFIIYKGSGEKECS